MHKGLVSTIIPVFNRPEMLSEAIESVLAQTYTSTEIIIVNDGSTDNTQQVIDHYTQQHDNVSSITISNSGPAIARQAGLDQVQGEFIQFLDSDDLIYPEKFSKQVRGLTENPELGISYCIQECRNINGDLLDATWMRTGERFDTMFPAMLGGRIWGTPTPLYRASLLEKVGPWKDLKNQEDWEYDCRIAALGVKLHYQGEALVNGRLHDNPHFGKISPQETDKLADKAESYLSIYQHAQLAGVSRDHPETKRFIRMTFMLARQCAALDLVSQAKALISVCDSASTSQLERSEYRVYSILSKAIGWQRFAKLATRVLG